MSLFDLTKTRLRRSFDLFDELVREIPESALSDHLPAGRSNTIGQQLWCVVGARESYRRAIESGGWAGFSCTLTAEGCKSRSSVLQALSASGSGISTILETGESFSDSQNELVLDLLEHEAAHQGQLIRYLYALKIQIPAGWKKRYALD